MSVQGDGIAQLASHLRDLLEEQDVMQVAGHIHGGDYFCQRLPAETIEEVLRIAMQAHDPYRELRLMAMQSELRWTQERVKHLRACVEAVVHFWRNDLLAFGDEATPTTLAGRFADIAQICADALETTKDMPRA